MEQPERPYRIIYRVARGNAVGQVEEPEHIGSDEPLDAIRMVKIDVLNSRLPLDQDDVQYVINELRAFVTSLASRASF